MRDRTTAINNWRIGVNADGTKHPFDIRDNPDQVAMGLFNDSMAVHDEGRIGKGYGSLTSTANPNYVAALDKQNELKKRLAASGALEGSVDRELNNNDAQMMNLAGMGNQRNEYVAGLENQDSEDAYNRQLQQFMKPKKPGFFDILGGSFAQSLGHTLGSPMPIPSGGG